MPCPKQTMATVVDVMLLFAIATASVVMTTTQDEGEKEDVKNVLNAMQKRIDNQDEQLNILRDQNAALEQKVTDLESQMQSSKTTATADSMFLATISVETFSISDDEVIVWDTAPINPGGHYNTIVGSYTVPYDGYYQFTVAKASNLNRSNFWLLVDEDRYLWYDLYTTAGSRTGTMTINLELSAGQIVRVENDYATVMHGTNSNGIIRSWFTGFLLYTL